MGNFMARDVSIIGVGYTPLGDVRSTPGIKDFSEKELYAMACMEAMENAGIDAKDIDAFYLGSSGPNASSKMKSATTHFSEWIGMGGKPGVFHDEGCGTSAYGIQLAVQAVASGLYDCVITGAVNINLSSPYPAYPPYLRRKMPANELWDTIYTGIDNTYEKEGEGGAGSNESAIIMYAKKYGVSFDQLEEAMVNYLIQKRQEAMLNPKSTGITMTMEEEAKANGFSSPLEMMTSDKYNPRMGSFLRGRFVGKTCDGASAVVICASDLAKKYTDKPIKVAGIATDTYLHKAQADLPIVSEQKMFARAYAQAGITDPYHEVEFMGIHDCTTIIVAQTGETAGYFEPGKGWEYMRDGRCGFRGDKPVSTDGGRVEIGHPLAPAFAIEVAEAVDQMRGEAGARQIAKPPKTSVIWGGGSGWHSGCLVLRREDW